MANKVTVLGGGAMGTACAILLSENPEQEVALWTRNPDHAAVMAQSRENERLLPGVKIPESVDITADVAAAIDDADILVVAVPTAFLREALTEWAPLLTADRPMVSVIKGIENETFLRPSEIISEILGHRGVVALGGPSHAEEISRRLPASVVAASGDLSLAKRVQTMFTTDRFRVYTNVDIIGVEMAAALKNIVAIAAGICDGLGFGDNAKAGLITRGLVEMTRFGTAMGAEASDLRRVGRIGGFGHDLCQPLRSKPRSRRTARKRRILGSDPGRHGIGRRRGLDHAQRVRIIRTTRSGNADRQRSLSSAV